MNLIIPLTSRPHVFTLLFLLTLLVFFSCGCDSGGGGDDADTTPPTVTINQPTDAGAYTTSSPSITISGTASDNEGIDQIRWESDTGGAGEVSGTASWQAQIDLSPGINQITVIATDAAGNSGSDV